MKLPHFKILPYAALCLLLAGTSPAQAVVAQSANDALSSDIFVGGKKDTSNAKAIADSNKKNRAEEARRKADAERRKAEREKREAAQKASGGAVFLPGSQSVNTQNVSLPTASGKNSVSDADDTPAVDINKHYASKLFSSLSGHITIEQKNIPRKISVTQGSTVQLNLENDPDTLWYFSFDKDVAKIKSDKTSGNVRTVVFETVGRGKTRIIMDYISTKTSAYKVIFTKRMLLMVD